MRRISLTLPAIALFALAGTAHAATVTISADYFSLNSSVVSGSGTPDIVGIAADGNPLINNAEFFSSGLKNQNGATAELTWWTPASPATALHGITPENDSTASEVSVNLFPYNPSGCAPGDYSVEATATFSSPTAATEQLSLSGNGESWLFLNGALIETHDGSGSFTATINESLLNGANTLTALYLDTDNAIPGFAFDPSIPLGAPATPEASTWAMLALGGVSLAYAYRRRSQKAPRLESSFSV
jgi:hypothetical protein